MPITTRCPGCQASFKFADELAGKKARCQSCKQIFVVPSAAVSVQPLPPEPAVPMSIEPAPEQMSVPVPSELTPDEAITAQPPPIPLTLDDEPVRPASRESPPPLESDDEDDVRPRRERPAAKGGVTPLTIVLLSVLLVYGGAIAACGGVLGYLNTFPNPRQPPHWGQKIPMPPPPPPVWVGDKGGPNDIEPKDPNKWNIPPGGGLPPRIVTLVNGGYQTRDRLGAGDALDRNNLGPQKTYLVTLQAGQNYVVVLRRDDGAFDPHLRLEDQNGKQLADGDDNPGLGVSRLSYRPTATATYRLLAETQNGGFGSYTLSVSKD